MRCGEFAGSRAVVIEVARRVRRPASKTGLDPQKEIDVARQSIREAKAKECTTTSGRSGGVVRSEMRRVGVAASAARTNRETTKAVREACQAVRRAISKWMIATSAGQVAAAAQKMVHAVLMKAASQPRTSGGH